MLFEAYRPLNSFFLDLEEYRFIMESDISSNDNPQSWEGRCIQPSNEKELYEVIGWAFDYRGDVTLQLKTGEQVVGYVFDRHEDGSQPYVKLYLPKSHEPYRVSYQEIAKVVFSGEDTAFGRSWEGWAQKWKKPESNS
jgi:hypothetical protein